jgi:hypothetical protein
MLIARALCTILLTFTCARVSAQDVPAPQLTPGSARRSG